MRCWLSIPWLRSKAPELSARTPRVNPVRETPCLRTAITHHTVPANEPKRDHPMTHRLPIRVYYEDTDMAGIVYYANYLRYIERGRSEWVRDMGMDQNQMKAEGVVFAVRRLEADYLLPAKLDDELMVETTVLSVSGVRMEMDQLVTRGDQELFHAVVTVVCIGESGRPVRLPKIVRDIKC